MEIKTLNTEVHWANIMALLHVAIVSYVFSFAGFYPYFSKFSVPWEAVKGYKFSFVFPFYWARGHSTRNHAKKIWKMYMTLAIKRRAPGMGTEDGAWLSEAGGRGGVYRDASQSSSRMMIGWRKGRSLSWRQPIIVQDELPRTFLFIFFYSPTIAS